MGKITKEEFHPSLKKELEGKLDTTAMTILPSTDTKLTSTNREISTDFPSLLEVKRIEGKTLINYVPLFNSGTWALSDHVIVSPTEITIKPDTVSEAGIGSPHIQLKPSTTYTFTFEGNASIGIAEYTYNSLQVGYHDGSSGNITFTTASNMSFIRIWLIKPATGTTSAKILSLSEGSSPQPYVVGFRGITDPAISNDTNGTKFVGTTTLYEGDVVYEDKGVLKQLTNWQSIDELWKYTWTVNAYDSYNKYLVLNSANAGTPPQVSAAIHVTDSRGATLMVQSGTFDVGRGDTVWSDGHTIVGLVLKNTDTGWGPSYTPTTDEIKAYFLGWKMINVNWGIYNPADGTKCWAYRTDAESNNNGWAGSTTTLPTVRVPTNACYTPYRVIYKLTTPQTKVITYTGAVTLEKGPNQLSIGPTLNYFSAPITAITVGHKANVGSVVEQLVDEVGYNKATIAKLDTTTVKKNEKLEWVDLSVFNCQKGSARVAKDSNGYVHVYVQVDTLTWSPGTTIVRLPVGYAPKQSTPMLGNAGNRAPYAVTGYFTILATGSVVLAYGTNLTDQVIVDGAIYAVAMFKAA